MVTELQTKWTMLMESVVTVAAYRVLGQSSLHEDPAEIFQFVKDESETPGSFGGDWRWTVEPSGDGTLGVMQWSNVWLSELGPKGPTTNLVVWGVISRVNTLVTRRGWWRMYLGRAAIENALGLERGTLKTRLDLPLP